MVAQQLRRSERRKTSGYESLRVGPRASNIRLQAVLCLLVGFVLSPNTSRFAHGQYKTGTALFEDKMAEAEVELTKTLQGGEYVEDIFYPDRQVSALIDPQSSSNLWFYRFCCNNDTRSHTLYYPPLGNGMTRERKLQ